MTQPQRYYDDLAVGESRMSRARLVDEAEILRFSREYDPQWFHTDPDAAKQSAFGELIASGVHVAALWRQLDHEINGDIAFVCGLAWDGTRWMAPLKAGDEIRVTSQILSLRVSESRPERGVAVFRCKVINQRDEDVLQFDSVNLVYRRQPGT